ncbi:glycosyltransferase family 2 protein [Blastococcus sp. SYSU D00669]
MSAPLVSILLPTYNGERFLRAALHSALAQSYEDIELVVGDDASTDSTPAILAEVAASDARVRVIRHETNLGGFGNPAALLGEARGEYVKFLLHDDVLAEDCVEELLWGMQTFPEVSLAFSRRALIDADGRPLPGHEFAPLLDRPGTVDGRELGDAMLATCTNAIGELTTVLFRRADVDVDQLWQVDGTRLEALGDLALWLGLLRRGPAFYTPSVLSQFRVHPGQSTWEGDIAVRSACDWPRLVDWGARSGYLADPAQRWRAHGKALLNTAALANQVEPTAAAGRVVESLNLSVTALAELAAGGPADGASPLPARAAGGSAAGLLAAIPAPRPAPRTAPLPFALAAPAVDAAEIGATVRALRDVLARDGAEKLLLAVPPALVERAVPLIEAALAEGPDIDVELFPTDDPAGLVPGSWLAVAPRGATWHDGRATAVHLFDAVPA